MAVYKKTGKTFLLGEKVTEENKNGWYNKAILKEINNRPIYRDEKVSRLVRKSRKAKG